MRYARFGSFSLWRKTNLNKSFASCAMTKFSPAFYKRRRGRGRRPRKKRLPIAPLELSRAHHTHGRFFFAAVMVADHYCIFLLRLWQSKKKRERDVGRRPCKAPLYSLSRAPPLTRKLLKKFDQNFVRGRHAELIKTSFTVVMRS
jgi:hypothetical protein